MKNQVQLVTYVDRLSGGGLPELKALLQGPLDGVFGGVHLLPFFHPIDGSDAGFDPIDHTQVDERLGSWNDIRALTQHIEVMADVIVNHMSNRSPQFLDWSARGADSRFDGLFLTREAVFPDGASDAEIRAIYRPRHRATLHGRDLGQWRAQGALDYFYGAANRHRRAAPAGSGVSAQHLGHVSAQRDTHGPA